MTDWLRAATTPPGRRRSTGFCKYTHRWRLAMVFSRDEMDKLADMVFPDHMVPAAGACLQQPIVKKDQAKNNV
jgi:hypothetical protein